ncbi:hypothetical protein EDD16DRAFT_1524557 [Pisolithus croceorrhizus]|nr:hypothetical protein EDD16DRAFT_1524557 [Pisolithus croceorrhizus]
MATIRPPKIVMTSGKTYLKWEYYVASTIAGGSGLAYSAEKGANVMTEVGQLVMDKLIETRPEAAQFQHKGFKFWDHMNQFVPPDKPPFTPPIQHYQSHQLQSTQAASQFTFVQYQTETTDCKVPSVAILTFTNHPITHPLQS